MEETWNIIEMERLGSDASEIATEIGQTRRRNRSLKRLPGQGRRPNIVTELPSRKNIGFLGLENIDTKNGVESANVSAEAGEIVEHMEQNEEFMDDGPKSVKDRIETLREMPQSLTLKRTVRSKLLLTLERRGRNRHISLATRVGHSLNVASLQMTESWKELLVQIEPWYNTLKNVEGHFGSGVATYFKFLRSLFFINLIVFFVSLLFVVVPQVVLISQRNQTTPRAPFSFGNLFTGEGFLSESVLFYGYYSNETLLVGDLQYSMPSAYFFSALVSYFLVFILLSISMAVSFRKNFIENAGDVKNVYANKVFCAWDFGIATQEAADLKKKSIHTEFKELLEEQNVKQQKKSWKQLLYIWGMQLSLNLLLLSCLAVAAYFTWKYLSTDGRSVDTPSAMMISLTITIVIHVVPMFLIWLLKFEEYDSPRTATYVTIIRTFVLDAVLIGVLVGCRLNSASDGNVCWETALGQEIYRLVLLDFLVGLVGTSLAQFIRYRIYLTVWRGIGHPEMDVARNTINLLYNEALFFIGLYFSPVLSLVILVKLWMTFYIRYWGATRDCRPSSRMWRAAQTETVFLTTAFIAFILVIVLYGYILSSVRTSACGPFRGRKLMYEDIVQSLANEDQSSLALTIILYVRKPGFVAVLLIALLLAVYYVRAIGRARARVVHILHDVLHLQAKDKEYLLALLSHLSRRTTPQQLGVRFRSEQELRSQPSPNIPSPSHDIRRSRSLFGINWTEEEATVNLLEEERQAADEKPRLRFNPIFSESSPAQDVNDSSVRYPEDSRTPTGDFTPTRAAQYTPHTHDDRVPSRIGFPRAKRI